MCPKSEAPAQIKSKTEKEYPLRSGVPADEIAPSGNNGPKRVSAARLALFLTILWASPYKFLNSCYSKPVWLADHLCRLGRCSLLYVSQSFSFPDP